MAYDSSKDVKIKDLGAIEIDPTTKIEMGVWKYNGGEAKIRVSKVTIGKKGDVYRESLAKCTLDEWQMVADTISEYVQDEIIAKAH